MKRTLLFILAIILLGIQWGYAQEARKKVRQGNQLYQEEKFDEAEIEYRKALEDGKQNYKALFNLGNSLYRQGRYEEAANIFEGLTPTIADEQQKAAALHNLGNAYLENQQFQEGVEAYKNALRLNPQSEDTRHNLAYAMQMLQDPPPQEQEQQDQQDQQQDQQKEQPGEDQQEQPQDIDQGQQPRPDELSPQDAKRILDALNQQEQKIQQERKKEEGRRVPAKVEREW
ncbi:MAG: tetratricopeptide repeat protein [Bacteroidales bacterium]